MSLLKEFSDVHFAGPLDTEDQIITNAFPLMNWIACFIEQVDMPRAGIAFEFLRQKKIWDYNYPSMIPLRKDEVTPDFLHECRLILSCVADFQAGLISKTDLEELIIVLCLHDMGEDYNILPNEIMHYFESKLVQRTKKYDFEEIATRMENMTLDRKLSASDIRSKLGIQEGSEINEHTLSLLCEYLEEHSDRSGKVNPMGFLALPNKDGKYIFSRHIVNGIIDWNSYADAFSSDRYTGLAKIKDRNEGLGTRIGPKFPLKSLSDYASRTYMTFSIENIGAQLAERHPNMAQAILANDGMTGALHRTCKAYIMLHPDNNPEGSKGYNIQTMRHIDYRDFFPRALEGYQYMPNGAMPFSILINRIKRDRSLGANAEILYEKILMSAAQYYHRRDMPLKNALAY